MLALLAKDTNADVCLEDHVDVVGAVSDRERHLLGEAFADHVNNIGLLLGRHSASQHHVDVVGTLQEEVSEVIVVVDSDERAASDNDSLLLGLSSYDGLSDAVFGVSKLLQERGVVSTVDLVLFHLGLEETG